MPWFDVEEGVKAMRPATSWNASKSAGGFASEPPTVAAGTVSVMSMLAVPFFGIVIEVALSETVCGDPCWRSRLTLKLAASLMRLSAAGTLMLSMTTPRLKRVPVRVKFIRRLVFGRSRISAPPPCAQSLRRTRRSNSSPGRSRTDAKPQLLIEQAWSPAVVR